MTEPKTNIQTLNELITNVFVHKSALFIKPL